MPLLFIAFPLIELYFIIVVGGMIGAFWTVMLIILTAVIGMNLLRFQGMSTLTRAQRNMSQGQVPAMEMMEGVALAFAGLMLIIPGFITDFIGVLFLIPASRQVIIRSIIARSAGRANFSVRSTQWQSGGQQPGSQQHSDYQSGNPQQGKPSDGSETKQPKVGRTIEGEYTRED